MKPFIKSNNLRILFSMLLILASLPSFNQVIYYDIDPDTTIIENDGHYDFEFIDNNSSEFQIHLLLNSPYNEISLKVLNDSCFASGIIFESCYDSHILNINDTLAEVVTGNNYWQWLQYPKLEMAHTFPTVCSHGLFLGKNDAYIGLKWIYNNIPYFCWVRVDVAEDASWFTVKDYAYGPYTVIVGSQTSTFLNEIIERKYFQVYKNERNIIVKTKNGVNLKQGILLNLIGQEFPIILQNNEVMIETRQFTQGLYLLYLSTDQGAASTIKIIIN